MASQHPRSCLNSFGSSNHREKKVSDLRLDAGNRGIDCRVWNCNVTEIVARLAGRMRRFWRRASRACRLKRVLGRRDRCVNSCRVPIVVDAIESEYYRFCFGVLSDWRTHTWWSHTTHAICSRRWKIEPIVLLDVWVMEMLKGITVGPAVAGLLRSIEFVSSLDVLSPLSSWVLVTPARTTRRLAVVFKSG